MKKIVIVLVIVAIAAGGLFYFKKNGKANGEETSKDTIVDVTAGTLMHSIEATGIISSNLDVEIKCKASGEIVTLPFDVSDTVKKGDLLLELDPIDEERNVRKAEVALESSQASLSRSIKELQIAEAQLKNDREKANITLDTSKIKTAEAEAKEKRAQELFDRKLASQEELDSAITTAVSARADLEKSHIALSDLDNDEDGLELKRQSVKLARTNVESNEIALSIAQQRLAETKVYAPIDGVITSRAVQEGQIITSATGNVSGGSTVMTISDISKLYVIASVDESDIGQVQVGQPVIITADAFPDETFMGNVDRVAPSGENVSNVVIFDVRIEVGVPGDMKGRGPGAGSGPPPGMMATPGAGAPGVQGKSGETTDASPQGANQQGADKMPDPEKMKEFREKKMKAVAALKPGMTANVEIVIERADNALTVPVEAVTKNKERKDVVTVQLAEDKTEEREVEQGVTDGVSVEIKSGLAEGDRVVVKAGGSQTKWRSADRQGGPPPGMMMRMH